MAKYRVCGGLAMTPEREMRLLREMSGKGWHVKAMKGIWYQFEEGIPQDLEYALNLESRVNAEMLSFYKASGWEPVIVHEGYQIFRAPAGTTPIFSDTESEVDVITRSRRLTGRWAAVFGILLLLWLGIMQVLDAKLLEPLILILFFVPFVFTFLPYLGYTRTLRKLK